MKKLGVFGLALASFCAFALPSAGWPEKICMQYEAKEHSKLRFRGVGNFPLLVKLRDSRTVCFPSELIYSSRCYKEQGLCTLAITHIAKNGGKSERGHIHFTMPRHQIHFASAGLKAELARKNLKRADLKFKDDPAFEVKFLTGR